MYILSFDVATKSLAVILLKINENQELLKKLHMFFTSIKTKSIQEINIDKLKKYLKAYQTYEKQHIQLIYYNVQDLTPESIKPNLTERTNKLKEYLINLNQIIKEYDISHVLIEYQMVQNNIAQLLMAQLLYEYSPKAHIINPNVKHEIYTCDELKYENIIPKYKTNYSANKNHTKLNFLKWLDGRPKIKEDVLKKVLKKNLDDLADSFCMAVSWYNFCY